MAAKKKTVKRKATKPTKPAKAKAGAPKKAAGGLRIRMYRVGFGDFFLVTVPSAKGPQHILIDCGVHSKDTQSIAAAVDHMAQETAKHLALIIVTHRHADHVTGFSKCKDVFKDFKVDRIWMSWYEDPQDAHAVALQANIAALASQLQQTLAARPDRKYEQYRYMVGNITEAMNARGGSQNPAAFEVLRGFPNKPPIDYYKAGDKPTLPQGLIDAGLDVAILGPPTDRAILGKTDKASEEYIASLAANSGAIQAFATAFRVDADAYKEAFALLPQATMEKRIAAVQPDMLAAKAGMANNMINNQSLVTLFTFKGKTLLFAGDAQWGNWANFMYGGKIGTELVPAATEILGKIDFYKVGHHGSTNATPKSALAAMRKGCVAMCSTAIDAYNEVPRDALITAIKARTNNQLARSDQVAAGDAQPLAKAGPLPAGFKSNVENRAGYIDYFV